MLCEGSDMRNMGLPCFMFLLPTLLLSEPQGHSNSKDKPNVLKELEAMGAGWRVDENKRTKPVISVNLSFADIHDDWLRNLQCLRSLKSLSLSDTCVGDRGMNYVKTLTKLRALDLTNTRVTDQGLIELNNLRNLETLNLFGLFSQVCG